MKTYLLTAGAAFSALLTVSLFVGCQTTGNERAEDTRSSMQNVENDIVTLNAQINATNSALATLVAPDQTNQEKAFETYSKSAERVQDAGNAFLKHTDAMATKGADYFSEWRKQGDSYTNPQIRAVSEERRAELVSSFTHISQASVGLRSSLQTYLGDIKDLRTYLSTDLTPKGVDAMRPTANKAMADGDTLKTQIEPVLVAISDAHRQLSPNPTTTPESR